MQNDVMCIIVIVIRIWYTNMSSEDICVV